MNAYIYFENGIIAVRAGEEAIFALKNMVDDLATRLSNLKDQWDQGDLLIKEAQAAFDAASASDQTLNSVTALGSVAFGIGLGLAIGGTGVVAVGGGLLIGAAGDFLYGKAIEAAKDIGQKAGAAAYDLWGTSISSQTNTNYRAAVTATARDPLAIDLTGDGIKTVAINPAAPILFDHNGDSAKSATGWLDGSDAWLVRDISKNGLIDSGLELFGVDTDITVAGVTRKATSGFEALAALDANGDKVFDSKDAAFTELRLWQDKNQNGISDAGELSTLAEKGIVSIGLTVTSTNTNLGNGNTVTGKAVVTRTTATGDATSEIDSVSVAADSAAYNLNLADNPFYSSFAPIDVSTAALALPDMHGSGGVRDLREAMSLGTAASATLVTTATQFAQATTRDAQMALLDQLIQQWGGTSSLTTTAALIATPPAATNTTAQRVQTFAQQNPDLYKKIIALEQFNGQTGLADLLNRWGTTLPTVVVTSLNDAYAALRNSVYGSLALQTRLKPYLDAISLVVDENGLRFDTAGLQTLLNTKYAASSDNALIDLAELSRSASSTLLATGYDFTSTLRTWVTALPANAPLRSTLQTIGVFSGAATQGTGANDIYLGDAGNNTFFAGDGNDVLSGDGGNDNLGGDVGNDTLDGGAGNDTLNGGAGADTYGFGRGSGKDTITDYEYGGANQDSIVLSGLNTVDLTATEQRGNDLILKFSDADQITVQNYFDSSNAYRVERFVFADGTVWGDANIKTILVRYGDASANSISGYNDGTNRIYGLDGNDYLYGGALADTLDGGIGDDNLSGNAGADILLGGAGNDTLYGNADADTLDGGVGNDYLDGGAGNDTYQFAVGSGVDLISDYDTTAGNTDVVTFAGVASTALTSLERKGNDLVIKYGASDQLTVANYFYTTYPGYKVEQFKFSDGVTWDEAAIKSRVITNGDASANSISGYNDGTNRIYGLDGNDYLYGGALADTLDGGIGDDNLSGNAGADILLGGAGNDTLYGNADADTLDGGVGNDYLDGGAGNDTYQFAVGSGVDLISDYDTTAGNTDVVTFAGVASTALTSLERKGNDLVIKYGASDQLTVANYFYTTYPGYKVEQFKFSDGVTWDEAAIKSRVITNGDASANSISGYNDGTNRIYGLDGNDYLYGGALADTLDGGIGDDNLSGNAGADILLGGAGNDTLYGNADADTLDGGVGNDYLDGGAGNDTYQFAVGSGVDLISDYDTTAGNTDVVTFAGVASTALTSLERKGNDLVIKYGASDQLTVANYFYTTYPGYKVEQFKFSDGVTWDEAAIKSRVITNGDASANSISGYNDGTNRIYGLDGNDYLYGGALADTLDGGIGDDNLSGNAGADILLGGAGNDTLYGNADADTLDGGVGNDYLDGGAGNDTYQFAVGSGVDLISDYDTTAGNTDVVTFAGVASTALTSLERKGNDLVIKYGASDQLTVANYFYTTYPGYKVEQFKFSDGVTWDEAAIKSRVITNGDASANSISGYNDGTNRIYGLDGNDYLYGGALADTLDGGIGDDNLSGNAGADILLGGAGNDTLYGNADADTLDGGVGNDYLDGGAGNDTYQFAVGSGVDRISDYDTTAGNTDVVTFAGVASTALTSLERKGNDLVIKYGASDQLTVTSYFDPSYPGYKVEQFKFSDGVTWDEAAIKSRVITNGDTSANSISGYNDGTNRIYGLDGNDYLYGGALADTLDGGIGDDNLSGNAGADILLGGAGNDTLYGNADADTLDGGVGNDYLDGGAGNDTYKFAVGSGVDRISDYDTTAGNTDVVTFAGVASTALTSLERKGNDLVIKYGASDQLTVTSYFDPSYPGYKVEQFKFSDGVTWDEAAIKSRVITNGDTSANSITGYNDGTNRIYGLDGNDNLYGGALADTLDGGIGDDNLSGNAGADILLGGAGNDTLYGNADADTLDGGVGNDYLDGGAGNDTYQFAVGSGVDLISDYDTTAGNTDVVTFAGVASTALTSLERKGNDLVIKYGASDQLTVTSYFDPSYPGYKVEQFKFSDGVTWSVADMVSLVSAANIFGTDLPETISGSSSSDIVRSLSGNDTLLGLAGSDFLFGGAGNDSLDGGTDNDWLYGEDGDDILIGGTGADTMVGGTGHDAYFVDNINDTIIETTPGEYDRVVTSVNFTLADQVEDVTLAYGVNAALKATGNALDNTLEGNEFDNVLTGLAGNDYLWGDAGNDTLIGGLGNDQMFVDSVGDVIQEDANGGYDTVVLFDLVADIYTLADNVEAAEVFLFNPATQPFATLKGNALDNSLTAGYDGMALYGEGGDDQLYGGDGNDSLYGGTGNDALWAMSGADSVLGGAGNDQYYVSDANNRITEYANEGIDTVTLFDLTTNSYTLSDNVEYLDVFLVTPLSGNVITLTGNAQNNGIEGNANGDTTQRYVISGGLGNDTLFGSDGNDTLDGGVGNDSLYGANGNDAISGASGDDTLAGGLGDDALYGGTGNDTYQFARGDGQDVVIEADATAGNLDRLNFGTGVSNDQLWFSMSGQDLVVSVIGTTDRVTIQQWSASAANHVEQFSAGGKTLADTQVANLVQAMASMSPPASGQTTLSSTQRAQLDPVLAASWA